MKLVPYDIKNFGGKFYKRSDNLKLLDEFAEGDLDCAKIEGYPQKKASYCAASLNHSVKVYKMFGIRAISRQGNVYLIKVRD